MKKALFLMAIITMLGCSKDEDYEEERQKNPPMSYEMFCYLYFDGYLVNDTTGLTNLTDYTKPNQEETTYLVGRKNQKLWIGKFNTTNKQSIKEYVSQGDFPIDFVYDLGYGKNETAHMDLLNVNDFFDTPKGFVCSIQSSYSLYTVYVFNSIQTKYYLVRDYDIYKGLLNWYDDTFLIRYYTESGNNILCLDQNGDTIFSGYIDNRILACPYIPINLNDFLYIDFDDDYIFIKSGTLQTLNIHSKRLNLFPRTEEKEIFTCEFGGIKNDILEFQLVIIGKSGNVQNKSYKINIKTFKLVE